jgi:hypothetical protein
LLAPGSAATFKVACVALQVSHQLPVGLVGFSVKVILNHAGVGVALNPWAKAV